MGKFVKSLVNPFNLGFIIRAIGENSTRQIIHNFSNYASHEYQIYMQNLQGMLEPTTAYIELTTYCPRNCIDCYIPKSARKKKQFMSVDILDKAMTKTRALGINIYAILGGETLLPETVPLLRHLVENYPESTFFVCTNGDYLTSRPLALEKIISHDSINMVLSIDGLSPVTHDAIRGKGSFTNIIKSANILHEQRRLYGVISTIRPENDFEVTSSSFVDWMISNGAAYMSYTFTDRMSVQAVNESLDRINALKNKPIFVYTSLYGHVGNNNRSRNYRPLAIDMRGNVFDARRRRDVIGNVNGDLSRLSSDPKWIEGFYEK